MAGKNCAWYGKMAVLILTATLMVRILSLIIFCLYSVPGDKSIMVATLPNGMEPSVLVWIAGISFIICVGVFIWRYAEYNAAKGMTRETNKMSPKFLGALILALASTIYVSYFLSAPLVEVVGIVDPSFADYITMGVLSSIVASIAFVILFTEGINGLAKFISQGVRAAKTGSQDLIAELEALKAELAATKGKSDEENDPKGN